MTARLAAVLLLTAVGSLAYAEEAEFDLDGPEMGGAQENASNPLAAVSNTDVRWQYFDNLLGRGRLNDYFVDGAFMVNPKLKVKYELHYWETNITGRSEHDWERALVKLIYFPKQGMLSNGTKYRLAVGGDYINDFDNQDKGIGQGADQIAPFVGIALGLKSGTTLIPLLQQFVDVSGEDVNITAARLIALQPLPGKTWVKLDVKVPYDWENDEVPADIELQYGINFNKTFALYVDAKAGIGGDKLYDWAAGIGLRFKY
jgi:hypothetical protein